MKKTLTAVGFIITGIIALLMLTGCSGKDIAEPLKDFFGREASAQEESAPVNSEDTLLYAQVNDAQGRALVKSNGEPVTVLVAYETATGGEPRINSQGILETHALGEMVTYTPGSPVTLPDGEYETYEGGEIIKDVLGIPEADESGNIATRSAGEIVTHGPDDIIYDVQGNRRVYNGEPMTYKAGEVKYDTDGEKVTYAVVIQKDLSGENIIKEDGGLDVRAIEIMTDASGNPLIEEDEEAATKQLEPQAPEKLYDVPLEAGEYYINNLTSPFVFFAVPTVEASRIAVVADEGVDPAQYAYENGEGPVENLQLEILSDAVPCFDMQTDPQGYVYFIERNTNKALSLAGDLRNGVNVLLKDIEKIPFPQYKYWDDPLFTVADYQKWIIKDNEDGTYNICSAVDESFVMTVDDQFGTQYANIMMWKDEGRDTQKYQFTQGTPVIERYIEEGEYYISSGLSNWMMVSLGNGNYSNGSEIYLDRSDQGDGQLFNITYDDYGFATIEHAHSGQLLTVNYGEARDGQGICQFEPEGGDGQRWIISPMEHGGYYIRSALNISEVLDLSNAEARIGNSIYLHWVNRTFAQSWNFNTEEIPLPDYYATMEDYAQNFSSATDYLILVSSGHNHVSVFQGSQGNWTTLFYWDCVTGKSSTPTVKGEYEIYYRTPSFDGNMDSPAWYTVYYATGFYPQYFFHSIIYYQNTMDIMDSSMGFNASHGCVRLNTDNAQWIYENIPDHTKVVSY